MWLQWTLLRTQLHILRESWLLQCDTSVFANHRHSRARRAPCVLASFHSPDQLRIHAICQTCNAPLSCVLSFTTQANPLLERPMGVVLYEQRKGKIGQPCMNEGECLGSVCHGACAPQMHAWRVCPH